MEETGQPKKQQNLFVLRSANYVSMCLRMHLNLLQQMRAEAHRVNDVLWCFSEQGQLTGISEKCRVHMYTYSLSWAWQTAVLPVLLHQGPSLAEPCP